MKKTCITDFLLLITLCIPAFAQKAPFPIIEHLLPPAKPSLIPQFEFADTLKEQEKQLASNPLLKRFHASRNQ